MGTPLNAQVSEVTHICDIRLARFCIWTNQVNPLLQAAKIMYEHNPMEEPTTKPRRCGAKTRSGTPCAKYPLAGKRRCRLTAARQADPKRLKAERGLLRQTIDMGALSAGALIENGRNTISLRSED